MGFLSKLFKPFKKIIRGVGKHIKRVSKLLWKPIKAVLKPLARVFGKLGPIGTIALGIMLPGIGGVFGSWLNGMGAAFQNVFVGMPKIFNALGHVGTAIQKAASWVGNAYESTIGRVFGKVSDVITTGIDKLTGGAATKFGTWMENFATKISYKGPGVMPDLNSKLANDAAISATSSVTSSVTTITTPRGAGPDLQPDPSIFTAPVPVDPKAKVADEGWWDKITGKTEDIYEGIVKPIQTGQKVKEFIDPSDPERQRFGGSAIGMLGQFGTSWSGNFTNIDFSDFNLQDSIQQNVKGLADLFASGFGATIPYGMDPAMFVQSMPAYGMQPEDMYLRVFGGKGGGD
jgi:hypothetical protein